MKDTTAENQKKFGEKQVDKEHYFDGKYLGVERFVSLHSQLRLCMEESQDDSYLEIGPGPGLLVGILKQLGRNITTVDFEEDLSPDYVAKLPNLPFPNEAFDVVCAFEVLEHIPWGIVPSCIDEMRRVAQRKILLSMPNQSRIYEQSFSISITAGKRRFSKLFWHKNLNKITNPSEHFWEIGHNGITVEDVLDMIEKFEFSRTDSFFVEPWFQFFVLEK